MAAVVAAFELGDFAALRVAPRQANRVQRGLGAGVDKANPLQRIHSVAHYTGDLALNAGGRAQGNALLHLLAHGRFHALVPVPEDLGRVVVGAIDVAPALDIPQVAVLATSHGERVGRVVICAFGGTGRIGAALLKKGVGTRAGAAIARFEVGE